MKYLLIIFLLISANVYSQDTTANKTISIVLPKKALWAFGYYVSTSTSIDSFNNVRKLPDVLAARIGSDIRPDSLINVTVKARVLAGYLNWLQAERNEGVRDFYRSVVNNIPAITNYTALQTQIINKASGNTSEKEAAIYVRDKFIEYQTALQNLWNENLTQGLQWIRN